jgi:hypothetical protein
LTIATPPATIASAPTIASALAHHDQSLSTAPSSWPVTTSDSSGVARVKMSS